MPMRLRKLSNLRIWNSEASGNCMKEEAAPKLAQPLAIMGYVEIIFCIGRLPFRC